MLYYIKASSAELYICEYLKVIKGVKEINCVLVGTDVYIRRKKQTISARVICLSIEFAVSLLWLLLTRRISWSVGRKAKFVVLSRLSIDCLVVQLWSRSCTLTAFRLSLHRNKLLTLDKCTERLLKNSHVYTLLYIFFLHVLSHLIFIEPCNTE